MSDADDLRARSDALRQQLRDTFGVRGRDLDHALRRARRLLPRGMRQKGARLVEAQAMLGHPKLERMIDFAELRAAQEAISVHLDSIDVADARRGWWLSLAGVIAFNLIVVLAAFITWMVWAGHL